MVKLLNWLFGSTNKKGRCRFWNHAYGDKVKRKMTLGTGSYIGDVEITKKYYYYRHTCTKCGDTFDSDIYREF